MDFYNLISFFPTCFRVCQWIVSGFKYFLDTVNGCFNF